MRDERVLVTYCSGSASTADAARTIAATLRSEGLAVVVADSRDVRELDLFSAVVVGSNPHPSRITKEALRFMRHFKAELQSVTVAFLPHKWDDGDEVRSWARALAGELRPSRAA